MSQKGTKVYYIKPWTVTTLDVDFSVKLKNILKRDLNPSKPNTAYGHCSDITLIGLKQASLILQV